MLEVTDVVDLSSNNILLNIPVHHPEPIRPSNHLSTLANSLHPDIHMTNGYCTLSILPISYGLGPCSSPDAHSLYLSIFLSLLLWTLLLNQVFFINES